jgi:hypothetical protein
MTPPASHAQGATSASTDPRVACYLEDLAATDPDRHRIIEALRVLVHARATGIDEGMMYGGIVYRQGGRLVAGLFAYQAHVSLEFGRGDRLDDPHDVLEGQGRYRRHIKFRELADVEAKHARNYIDQALAQLRTDTA